ncbi:MAG: PDZ domain-containing protein, partial [Verrucomicrobiota bacterium]|nr:PDZ domain-containing protein [Verrucomicrobiota bacterium]
NLDMVGRLKKEGLNVQGTGSSGAWEGVLDRIDKPEQLGILRSTNPHLPTDTTPLYKAGVPVLSIFTGLHGDYHTPRDTIETLNFTGLHKVTGYVRDLTVEIARLKEAPGYVEVKRNRRRNVPRVRLGIQFEAIEEGIRVTSVQEGSAAAQSGLQNDDILRQLDGMNLGNGDDLIAVLRRLEPGKEYPLAVGRKGKDLKLRIVPEKR